MVDPLRESPGPTGFAPVDLKAVRENRNWFIALGIGSMVLGIIAIFLPFAASMVTAIALGWLIVINGLIEGYHALQNRGWGGAGWELVSAVVQVAAGLILVAFPLIGKIALIVIVAAYFIAEGALKLIRAAQHRGVRGGGWLTFDGLISLALGIWLLVRGPVTALWVLGILVGINLLAGGLSMLLIGTGSDRPLVRPRI
ncbi:Hypothetical protein A7982_06292 [Minicystis rosea]|nr:Hypothetical protein A7982_06292 [Minicystis rosea]